MSQSVTAKSWTMAKRPEGEPDASCFGLEEQQLPELQDGEVLVRNLYLSLDPYMRGRMRDAESYATPLKVGQVMVGETAGEVLESRHPKWKAGDKLCVHGGWRTHLIVKGDAPNLTPVDESLADLPAWLGVVGMPGRTAYFGLKEVGKPKAGETLVVSAASGAVGSVVGQMAKILGLRVVGVAGGAEKCGWCEEVGFDACVDYKAPDFEERLREACPDGVDIYFENVGGAVSRAVAGLLNPGARVPICGFISLYNAEQDMDQVETPFDVFGKLDPAPEHRFFVVTEFMEQWPQATKELAGWIKEGKLQYRETLVDGFDSAPENFLQLFRGTNFGKLVVRI